MVVQNINRNGRKPEWGNCVEVEHGQEGNPPAQISPGRTIC